MGYNGISFGGITYTSDTTISVVKNQQYSIIAFNGSGLFQNWEGTNVNLPVPNSSNTIVTITGDTATLKAVFPEMTPTPTPTPTLTSTPTPTPTATSTPTPTIDLSAVTTYTISGCSSSNVIVADLGPGAFFPGDTFFLDFTGSTASECYTIVNKIDTAPTDGSNPISSYSNCADCIDGTTTTYTISGCTTLNVLVADLGPGAFAAGDIYNMTFTGATPSGCYRIVNKIVDTPTDTGAPLTFYFNCNDCEASLVTPTPTPTLTSTPTPTPTATEVPATSTPTPTPTPIYYYYYLLNCNLGDNKYGRSLDPDINLSGFTFNVDTNICYTIAGNDDGPYYDYDLDNATIVTDCTDILCSTPTPTPTSTPTPTPTATEVPPTETPTPTPTSGS
jgi:hypothetical protein